MKKSNFYGSIIFLSIIGLSVFIFLQGTVTDLTKIGMSIFSMPANAFGDSRTFLETQQNISENYVSIEQQRLQNELLSQNINAIKEENKKLKEQINIGNTLTDFDLKYGTVIVRNPDNWENSFVIDRGSLDGVKMDAAVLSNGGLVGRITEVYETTSVVSLLTSNISNAIGVHCVSYDTNLKQVSGLTTKYEKDSQYLVFQPTSDSTIAPDSLVTTSGFGGVFPAGLPVGKIKFADVNLQYKSNKSQYFVTPTADFNQISIIMIAQKKG